MNPINYWYQRYLSLKAEMDKMKAESIEGYVYKVGKITYVKETSDGNLTRYLSKFNNGDKVRIIVLPKED